MRLRNLVILGLTGWLVYKLSPHERQAGLRGFLREAGRLILVTMIVYWIWLLGSYAWRAWS